MKMVWWSAAKRNPYQDWRKPRVTFAVFYDPDGTRRARVRRFVRRHPQTRHGIYYEVEWEPADVAAGRKSTGKGDTRTAVAGRRVVGKRAIVMKLYAPSDALTQEELNEELARVIDPTWRKGLPVGNDTTRT